MNSSLFILSFFLVAGHLVHGEIIKFQQCSDDPNAFPCDIDEVRIDPCKEAKTNAPCKVKRGTSASISFDFTPKFNGNLSSRAYWARGITDIPFVGMDTSGCKFTTCPVTEGTQSSFTYNLYLAKNLPIGVYDVKWKLWNEEEKQCCMLFKVKLTK